MADRVPEDRTPCLPDEEGRSGSHFDGGDIPNSRKGTPARFNPTDQLDADRRPPVAVYLHYVVRISFVAGRAAPDI
jgi:hypothetical protein